MILLFTEDELVSASPNQKESLTELTEKEYDYIIIGAGFTGLLLAARLKPMGYTCLILEKRDRIGGNIQNGVLAGSRIDLGMQHIDPTRHKRSLYLLKELKLTLEQRIMTTHIHAPGAPVDLALAVEKQLVSVLIQRFQSNRASIISEELSYNEFMQMSSTAKGRLYMQLLFNRVDRYTAGVYDVLVNLSGISASSSYISPQGGWMEVLKKLYEMGSPDIRKECHVHHIKTNKDSVVVGYGVKGENVKVIGTKVIFTGSVESLGMIEGIPKDSVQLDQIISVPRMVIWCWHAEPITTTHRRISYPLDGLTVYVWHPKTRITAVELFGYNALLWNNSLQTLSKESFMQMLSNVIKVNGLSAVADMQSWYSDSSSHQYLPTNFNIYQAKKRSDLVSSIYNRVSDFIWVAGEAYSNFHGSVEGSIESVDLLLGKENFLIGK